MDSDILLMQRMKNGDERAIERFVQKHYADILRYCCLHIHDRNDAEDMAQETFAHFFRSFGNYRHVGKARNYLYVIASNCCKDFYRKKREIPMEELPDAGDRGMEDVDRWLDVRRSVDALPQELKETAILFFFQGMKQADIGKILGISLPLVKYRIRKAKEILVKQLEQEGIT